MFWKVKGHVLDQLTFLIILTLITPTDNDIQFGASYKIVSGL